MAGLDFQSSGVSPSLIVSFSSPELCCLGADTIVADLSAHGEITLVLQEPVKQIKQLFHRARFPQRLAIEPQSLGVGNRILQFQTEKPHEREAIAKPVFRLIFFYSRLS